MHILACVFWLTSVCLCQVSGQRVSMGFCLVGTMKQLCQVAVPLHTSAGGVRAQAVAALSAVSLAHHSSDSSGYAVLFRCVFIIFLTPVKVQHLFVYLLTIWMYFLVICFFRIFPFFHWFSCISY